MKSNQKTWRGELRRELLLVLVRSGVKQAEQAVDTLIECLKSGRNPNNLYDEDGPHATAPSTFCDWIRPTNPQRFQQEVNKVLGRHAFRSRRRWPPTRGTVIGVGDIHQQNHHLQPRADAPKAPLNTRRAYFYRSHSDNRTADFAEDLSFMVLVWEHLGERIVLPAFMVLVTPMNRLPAEQVDQFFAALRAMRLQLAVLLLDRGYDSSDVRIVAAKRKVSLGFRVNFSSNKDKMVTIKGGQRMRMRDLMNKIFVNKVKQTIRNATGRKRLKVDFIAEQEASFADGVPYRLVMRLRGYENVATGGFVLNYEHSFCVAFAPHYEKWEALLTYKLRWKIEVFFHLLALDAPKPRPQKLAWFLISTFGYALRILYGLLKQVTDRLAARMRGSSRSRLKRLTLVSCSRRVLTIDSTLPET